MQHVKYSNRNIVSEISRIRNIIWEGEQQPLLEQPIIAVYWCNSNEYC